MLSRFAALALSSAYLAVHAAQVPQTKADLMAAIGK